jgi:hypothetical protein
MTTARTPHPAVVALPAKAVSTENRQGFTPQRLHQSPPMTRTLC